MPKQGKAPGAVGGARRSDEAQAARIRYVKAKETGNEGRSGQSAAAVAHISFRVGGSSPGGPHRWKEVGRLLPPVHSGKNRCGSQGTGTRFTAGSRVNYLFPKADHPSRVGKSAELTCGLRGR
jgi:hypothetical protein